ncbi:MAG: NfeD family protein, partial [Haloarculaceae archaeon]
VFLPPGLETITPLILSVVVLVTAGATLWGYRQFEMTDMSSQGRTSDSASLRGKSGRVVERVTETEGIVKLEGGGFNPNYQARSSGDDIPEGEEVIVLDPGGGNVLTVESMAGLEDGIDRELAKGRSEDAATAAAVEEAVEEATGASADAAGSSDAEGSSGTGGQSETREAETGDARE